MTVFRLRANDLFTVGTQRTHVRVYDHLGSGDPVVIVGKPTDAVGSINDAAEEIASTIQREFFAPRQRWAYVEHHATETHDGNSWPTFNQVRFKSRRWALLLRVGRPGSAQWADPGRVDVETKWPAGELRRAVQVSPTGRQILTTPACLQLPPLLGETFVDVWPAEQYTTATLDAQDPEEVHFVDAGHMPGTRWQRIKLAAGGEMIGKLTYGVCDQCRLGVIAKISVYRPGQGIGERTVRYAVEHAPDYTWITTWQQADAVGFWELMSRRLGHAFTGDSGRVCRHIHLS